ncbi:MAG: hypothetical protein R2809_00675 [Flavobacteriales bacterium]
MKKALTILFLGFSTVLFAQHTATVQTSFQKDHQKNEVSIQFQLDSELNSSELASVLEWASDNSSLLILHVENKVVSFKTAIDRLERAYFTKPFAMMNIDSIIVEGRELSIEEFFTTNNL